MPIAFLLSESYIANATLFHSFILQCSVRFCGLQYHYFHKLCHHKGVFSLDSHLLDGGYSTRKLSQSPLVHWTTPSTRCSYRHFRCGLLLREDSYSSSAFPPCESQSIDLLRYRLALPVACFLPLGHWLVPVIFILRSSVYNVKFSLDTAVMWLALTSSCNLR